MTLRSTSRIEISDSSTPWSSIAKRASRAKPSSSTGWSTCSLATKTLTPSRPSGSVCCADDGPAPRLARLRPLRSGLVVASVCLDDVLHDAVADNVPRRQVHEGQAVDPGEDLTDDVHTRVLSGGQVDLGDVAGDHGLGVEPEPGQEHLHLLRRGVLRLVEHDERVVEGVVRHQEIIRHVQRVGRGDLDAEGLLLAGGLDAVDEAHRAATAVTAVQLPLARQPEGLEALGQTDVEYVCIRAVVHVPSPGASGRTSRGGAGPPVRNASKRPDQEDDVVAQPG